MLARPESRPRLLLADRVKGAQDSFLAPLLPALRAHYDVRFVSLPPGDALALAIGWSDIVWFDWCWDHAAWATTSGALGTRPCVIRLHSIEALQTDYPAQVDWPRVARLVMVGDDIADVLAARFPWIAEEVAVSVIHNGIDGDRFAPGAGGAAPDPRRVAWVGHLEPKKDPMLMLQVAHALRARDPAWQIDVAGTWTDLRTRRYVEAMLPRLGLEQTVRFCGHVPDMPGWYADKGVILSTSMYESFGMSIGEAMACGAAPVVHAFPGAGRLWPAECLFASVDEAIRLIEAAEPGRWRDWVLDRYGVDRQVEAMLSLLAGVAATTSRPAGGATVFPGDASFPRHGHPARGADARIEIR